MADVADRMREATEFHKAGKLREAIAAYESVVEQEPGNARAWAAMGQIWSTRLVYGRAVECFEKAVEAAPGEFIFLYLLALPLRRLGRLEDSIAALTRATELRSDHWESHLDRIAALERMGRDAGEARAALEEALPGDVGALERLGEELAASRKRAALACYQRANALDGSSAARLVRQGELERELGLHEAALASFERAVELDASAEGAHAGLAWVCERLGRNEEARWYAGTALGQDPRDIELGLAVARLDRKEGDLRGAVARLRAMKGDPRIESKWTYASVCIEMGLALDAGGDAQGAFAQISEGKAVLSQRRAARRFPRGGLTAWIGHVREKTAGLEGEAWQEQRQGTEVDDGGRGPIFVVGFPGSGAETIAELAARSAGVRSSGGAPWLSETVRGARELRGSEASYPDVLGELNEEQVRALRAQYLAAAGNNAGDAGTGRIVDALDMNITRLAGIARLFPEAKIVVALRDPRDCCLECYFSLAEADATSVHFFDLDATTALYEKVMDLYLASRDRLGLEIAEVRVEDVAADPAALSRRVVEFVGETWSGSVTEGLEIGASRWRRYADRLEPYSERLERFVGEFGYGE